MKSSFSIDHQSIPKVFRKKAGLIAELFANGKVDKLRELRDSSINFKIDIYHHSIGTDSYFHDIECRYYTWSEVESINNVRLENGEHFSTVVIPYKEGIHLCKGSQQPNSSLN